MIIHGYKFDLLYVCNQAKTLIYAPQNLDTETAVIACSLSKDAFVPLYRCFIKIVKSPSLFALICGTLDQMEEFKEDTRDSRC